MPLEIRTYQPGDEETQTAIYNTVAAPLPGFKPAAVEEVRRRVRAAEFDPLTRFYAVAAGQTVGYCSMQPNGRVGFPWGLPGHQAEGPLLAAVLAECRKRGIKTAFSAYRADWTAQTAFFESNGFRKARDMVNFAQNLLDLPTMVIRRGLNVTPLKREDIPALVGLGAGVIRLPAENLAEYLFANLLIPPDSLFVLRKADDTPQGVGILIGVTDYANPLQVDAAAPCFRLGAFGTEGMSHKRISGLFSFVARDDADVTPLGLDLLSFALGRIQDDSIDVLGAQVPSDAKHLLGFYQKYFRKQGSFPVFEREI